MCKNMRIECSNQWIMRNQFRKPHHNFKKTEFWTLNLVRRMNLLWNSVDDVIWAALWQNQENGKTQISLGIPAVWSEYSLCAK